MESLEAKEAFKVKNETQIDRVILGCDESALVQKWVEYLNKRADGLIRFTKADVVNFLLSSRPANWETDLATGIARHCYDEAKWLGWSLNKVKAARKSRTQLSFDDLVKFRDDLLGGSVKKVRKQKNQQLNDSEAFDDRSTDAKKTPVEL
jgi:hypothetical protein